MATILLLVITLALVGLAYGFIQNLFLSRTAVTLSLETEASTCPGNTVTIYVRNDGTQTSGSVTVTVTNATGTSWPCTINSINPGTDASCSVTKTGSGAGTYKVRASTAGSTTTGSIYCVS